MELNAKIKEYAITELKKELDSIEIEEAAKFIDTELKSFENNGFEEKKAMSLKEKGLGEKERIILNLMLLGLGRNRICNAMIEFSVGRGDVEKVRDVCDLKNDETKKVNEKYITSLKWKTKNRKEHKNMIDDSTWEKIKEEYSEGISPVKIGKKFGFSSHIISQRLREEGLFDNMRSTLTRNKIAEGEIENIGDEFFINLMKEYKTEPVNNIWGIAQRTYPWLLRRQFLDKLKELNIERTEEEVLALRIEKSKVSPDNSFEIPNYIIDVINEVFGSVDEMKKKYTGNKLGSYSEIAKFVSSSNQFKIDVTERQIYRLITNNANFKRVKSLEQENLHHEIKKIFKGMTILEEVAFSGNKRVDIYIPDLNIAIDYNGDYWHSDAIIYDNFGKTAFSHHKDRSRILKEKGIKLIYIWGSDWNNRKLEIINLLKKNDWENELLNQYKSPVDTKGPKSLHEKFIQEQIKQAVEDIGYGDYVKIENGKLLFTY